MITVEHNTEGDAVRARGSARHARGRRRAAARTGDDRRARQRQASRRCSCIRRASAAPINASPIAVDRESPAERFAVDNVIIAVGQHASLQWLPDEFKNERGTIKIDRFGRLGDTKFFAAGDIVQARLRPAADGRERRRRRQARGVQPRQGSPRRAASANGRSPIDVITDLARMNMTYFPKFPRVQQAMLAPTSRRRTQDEVIQAYSEEQAVEEANRCFSCGTCNACDNCYLVCPEPCIVRSERSNGLYKILVDYCKGCRVCIEECPTGCLEGVPELDFDTGVVRMDTAFAITQGLHGRQADELKPAERAAEGHRQLEVVSAIRVDRTVVGRLQAARIRPTCRSDLRASDRS